MPIDFRKLADPAYIAESQARRAAEQVAQETLHQRRLAAVKIVRDIAAVTPTAMSDWERGFSRNIEQALYRHGYLTDKQHDTLMALADRFRDKIEEVRGPMQDVFVKCDRSALSMLLAREGHVVGDYDDARGGVPMLVTDTDLEVLAQYPADFAVERPASAPVTALVHQRISAEPGVQAFEP